MDKLFPNRGALWRRFERAAPLVAQHLLAHVK